MDEVFTFLTPLIAGFFGGDLQMTASATSVVTDYAPSSGGVPPGPYPLLMASFTVVMTSGISAPADPSASTPDSGVCSIWGCNRTWGDPSDPDNEEPGEATSKAHEYLAAGAYTVSLEVTNQAGSDTAAEVVTVPEAPPPSSERTAVHRRQRRPARVCRLRDAGDGIRGEDLDESHLDGVLRRHDRDQQLDRVRGSDGDRRVLRWLRTAPRLLFPAGISTAFFQTYPYCAGPVSADPTDPCYPQHLTPGNLNVPGGFGWLKFGCDGYGLGQEPPANIGGCRNDKPFLQEEIGPPSKSYGCCTVVGVPGSLDQIGSLPGNKASADCSYYIDNQITVTVPIWDTAGGTGQNAWYHIVGFAGFQITECEGGKDIEGVWRKAFFLGPTTSTPSTPGVPEPLGVQLVK